MIALNTQITEAMEQQQNWSEESAIKQQTPIQNDDEAVQELAKEFGLGITRQGGNY